MPSPFSGMDPYLEAHWHNVRASLIIYSPRCGPAGGWLPGLPYVPGSRNASSWKPPLGFGDHPLFPDVHMVEYTSERRGWQRGPERAWPWRSRCWSISGANRPPKPSWKSSIAKAAIAWSPSLNSSARATNRPAPDREQYLGKRREVCASSFANLVEISLNRFGSHSLAFPLDHIKLGGEHQYMTCVRRAARRYYSGSLPDAFMGALPIVNVPLRPDDKDVPLDLQALIEQCYRDGELRGDARLQCRPRSATVRRRRRLAKKHLRAKGIRSRNKPRRENQHKKR